MTLFADDAEVDEKLGLNVIHKIINGGHGRTKGAKEISHEQKVAAGVLGNLIGTVEAEKVTGVKQQEISYLKKGMIGRQKEDEELKKAIDERLGEVKSKALDKLLESIDCVNLNGLEDKSALEASKVVSNLASVVDKVTEKNAVQGNQVNVIVYAPKRDSVDSYDTVDIPTIVR